MLLSNGFHTILRGCLACTILLATLSALRAQQADGRLPVPDAVSQAESGKLLREVYKVDFDQAGNAAQRLALAKKLVQEALASKQDPVARYVLLKTAADMAVEAGDIALAFQVVDEIAKHYRVSGVAAKAEILTTIRESIRSKAGNQALASSTLDVIDEAVAADEYELAERVLEMGTTAAKKARDGALVRHLAVQRDRIEESIEAYRGVERALAKLGQQPVDPEANRIVGDYYCLRKQDWEKGLPMVALSNSATLKPLAVRELEGISSPTEMLELAEGWFEASKTKQRPLSTAILGRATHWYERALPGLSGLPRLKAEQRILELRRMMIPSGEDVVNFHLVATIDGSDTLEILPAHLKWTHHRWGGPKSVTINGVAWSPNKTPVLPYLKAFGAVLPRVDFNSASLEKIRGRGGVLLEKRNDGVLIRISDGAGGADTYEFVVTLKRLTR